MFIILEYSVRKFIHLRGMPELVAWMRLSFCDLLVFELRPDTATRGRIGIALIADPHVRTVSMDNYETVAKTFWLRR